MEELVSIDPGLKKVAYAFWDESGTLVSAGLVIEDHDPGLERAQKWANIAARLNLGPKIKLVVEIPQVYEGPQAEDRNDLIDLAGVVGALAVHCGSVEWSPTPREWKGQLPKEISQARVEAELTPEEKTKIKWPSKSLRHNVYDAIHLGLTYLKREGLR